MYKNLQAEKAIRHASVPLPVVIFLLAVVLPIGFQAGPLALTGLRVFLLFLTPVLIFRLFVSGRERPIATDYLFFLHMLWIFVSLLSNHKATLALEQVGSTGVEFLGGYLLGRMYIRSHDDFLATIRFLVILVLAALPFTAFELLTGRPLIIEMIRKLPGITSVGIVTIGDRLGLERVQSTFAHPIHYGLFCSVVFSLCFVGLAGHISKNRRWFLSTLILFCCFASLSSGALLAVALQVILISWHQLMGKSRYCWQILLGSIFLFYIIVDTLSNRTPLQVFMSYATFSAHNAYWRSIIFDWGVMNVLGSAEKDIPSAMLFGIGLNEWVRPWYMFSGSMDNFWLVIAVRYGLPGLITLLAGWILLVTKIGYSGITSKTGVDNFRRAWMFTLIGLSFTLCTVHVWTSIYAFVFFFLGSGSWILNGAPAPVQERSSQESPHSFHRTKQISAQDGSVRFTRFGAGTNHNRR